MITQKELAKILGVSQVTVSAILRNGPLAEHYRPELRRKVLETAAKLGYSRNEIACAIRNKKSNVIGFVTQAIDNGYAASMLQGIVDAAAKRSYLVKTFSVFRGEKPSSDIFQLSGNYIADQCIGQRMMGLICYDIVYPTILNVLSDRLNQSGIPLVLAGGVKLEFDLTCLGVYSDMKQAGELLAEYVHKLKHKRIALLGEYGWAPHTRSLLKSFMKSAKEKGFEEKNIDNLISENAFDFRKIEKKLIEFRPTGIFCTSDFVALNVITSLINKGYKIPEDFSVIGYGNLGFSKLCVPSITSIEQNLYDIGYRAADLLLDHGCTPIKEQREEYITHSLIERNSSAVWK